MKKAICTTTINPPTKALKRFIEIAERDDWHLFIAGDLKTPHEGYANLGRRVHYLSPGMQKEAWPELSELIGWNCIQRRNFAFLAAYDLGAEIFATVDDDNIPLDNWGECPSLFPPHALPIREMYDSFTSREQVPVLDPLVATNHRELWHRGYPLELVNKRPTFYGHIHTEAIFDIQADFWDGEADVDAVCRMTLDSSNCKFSRTFFPFTMERPSPFNSQNTFLTRRVMPHYFMHVGVGRFDDILAAYHVQAQGFRVVYGPPSVVQERNAHDVMKDFAAEVWGYQNCLKIASAVQTNKRCVLDAIPERSQLAFEQYQRHFD